MNNTIEKTINEINICREVADGLRIYFDFTLHDLLLYRHEQEQYCNLKSSFLYNEQQMLVKEEPVEYVISNLSDNFTEISFNTPYLFFITTLKLIRIVALRNSEVLVKEEYEDTEYAHLPPFQEHDPEVDTTSKTLTNSKRRLRSCRVSSIDENRQLRSYEDIKQDTGTMSR